MGKTTSVDPTSPTACCNYLGSPHDYLGSTTQTSGIPRVTCTSTGNVIEINWNSQSLQGPIPAELANLTNLQRL
jgi:hypothetical protein